MFVCHISEWCEGAYHRVSLGVDILHCSVVNLQIESRRLEAPARDGKSMLASSIEAIEVTPMSTVLRQTSTVIKVQNLFQELVQRAPIISVHSNFDPWSGLFASKNQFNTKKALIHTVGNTLRLVWARDPTTWLSEWNGLTCPYHIRWTVFPFQNQWVTLIQWHSVLSHIEQELSSVIPAH